MDSFCKAGVKQRTPNKECPLFFEERLRGEPRRRAIVVVGIAHPVRIELDLAIVEVEVRSVVEANIVVRIIAFAHLRHRKLSSDKP